jgi:hypothetical protein
MEKIYKICNNCKQEKEISAFYKYSNKTEKYRPCCISCTREKENKRAETEREKNSQRGKIYYKNNKDKVLSRQKNNSKKIQENFIHKDYTKTCNKCNEEKHIDLFYRNKKTSTGYDATCKECIKTDRKTYRKENPIIMKELLENRHKKAPHIIAWRNLLASCLRRLGQKKEGKTIDILGYSAIDLRNHIESLFTCEMSWSNHGEWHIDHIKMVTEFDKNTLPSIVNALSNLRPLWATTRKINGITYEGNLNRSKYC